MKLPFHLIIFPIPKIVVDNTYLIMYKCIDAKIIHKIMATLVTIEEKQFAIILSLVKTLSPDLNEIEMKDITDGVVKELCTVGQVKQEIERIAFHGARETARLKALELLARYYNNEASDDTLKELKILFESVTPATPKLPASKPTKVLPFQQPLTQIENADQVT